jgi:hypothetical protein
VSRTWLNKLADDRLKFFIPALVLTLAGFWVAYPFVNPAPPTSLVALARVYLELLWRTCRGERRSR